MLLAPWGLKLQVQDQWEAEMREYHRVLRKLSASNMGEEHEFLAMV